MKSIIIGKPESFADALIESKTPHKVIYTNRSVEIEVNNNGYIFTELELTKKDLAFIGRTKKEVTENSERLNLPERSPNFFRIYPIKRTHFSELIELDINSAYWEAAFRIGLISPAIYEIGKEVKKDVRLIAFGAAATHKRIFQFDGEDYTLYAEEENEAGRKAYFYVASQVCGFMAGLCEMIPGAAILYWVDAMVILPAYQKHIGKYFEQGGYNYKVKTLLYCKQTEKDGFRSWRVTEKETGRTKEFRENVQKNKEIESLINRKTKK